ncbi:MAG: TonB family protein [Candidatus Eisenbacteria bacterium]|nr:TonB family protein [Candidatus Eisenbacteria bacterium]
MSPYLTMHMTAEQELKNNYPRFFRLAFLGAIVLHALMFLLIPEIEVQPYQLREERQVEAIEIPDQIKVPPPPKEEAKPQVPVDIAPSEEADVEETIESTVFDVDAPPELPPAPARPEFFTAFDEAPQVVQQVLPEYPEMARQSELEGVVLVRVRINEFGDVVEATVVKGVPGLNQAAIDAALQWRFTPAKQRDVPVKAQIVIPIRFTLRG